VFTPSTLKYNADGLIPAIVQDEKTGEILMLAYMNQESLQKTLETGKAWYYSRSRQKLWLKGETSGHYQLVKELRTDCDQDAILLVVEQIGPGACHDGYRSCFHYLVTEEGSDAKGSAESEAGEAMARSFDPEEVYGTGSGRILTELYQVILDRKAHPVKDSYTGYLFEKGIDKILKKVGEEASEVIIGAKNPGTEELVYEAADLLYHLLVLLAEKGAAPEDVFRELESRRLRRR